MMPVKPVVLISELIALAKSLLDQGLVNLIPLGGNLKRDLSDAKEPLYRVLPKAGRLQRDGSIKMVASWRALVEKGPTPIEQVEY